MMNAQTGRRRHIPTIKKGTKSRKKTTAPRINSNNVLSFFSNGRALQLNIILDTNLLYQIELRF